jgi:hypothetical protein
VTAAAKYRNLPIRQKLRVIIMVTVGAALLLAGGAVLIYDYFGLSGAMENDLRILAQIFASDTSAALTL